MDSMKAGVDALRSLIETYGDSPNMTYSQLLQGYKEWKKATHNSDVVTVSEMQALKKHAKEKEVKNLFVRTSFYRRIWNEV